MKWYKILNNDLNISTFRLATTIDAVFVKYIEYIQSVIYVCYFSYHKTIILFMEHPKQNVQHKNNNQCNCRALTMHELPCDIQNENFQNFLFYTKIQ